MKIIDNRCLDRMQLKLTNTALNDCYELTFPLSDDARGRFAKPYQKSLFPAFGFEFAEIYFSTSKKNVVRGMHFQVPPHEHTKIVTCISGRAFDVVMDLRQGSPTYGQSINFDLRADNGRCIFIPPGFAHGFCSLQDNTVLSYFVSSEHSAKHDTGNHWKDASVPWPTDNPIISQRDASLPSLSEFETPFK